MKREHAAATRRRAAVVDRPDEERRVERGPERDRVQHAPGRSCGPAGELVPREADRLLERAAGAERADSEDRGSSSCSSTREPPSRVALPAARGATADAPDAEMSRRAPASTIPSGNAASASGTTRKRGWIRGRERRALGSSPANAATGPPSDPRRRSPRTSAPGWRTHRPRPRTHQRSSGASGPARTVRPDGLSPIREVLPSGGTSPRRRTLRRAPTADGTRRPPS